MSSRRKQYKPKSFGVNDEDETGASATVAAPPPQDLLQATKPTESVLNPNPAPLDNDEQSEPSRKRQRNDSEPQTEEHSAHTDVPSGQTDVPSGQTDYYEPESEVLDDEVEEDDCDEEDEEGDEECDEDLDDTNLDYSIGYGDDSTANGSRSFNQPTGGGRPATNNRNRSTGYSNSQGTNGAGSPDLSDSHLNSTAANLLLMFKCKVCGKGFKHRRSLNRHVKLHSGEKNFKCPFCTTAFARSDHLKAHIRTHNNSKPYRCSVCQCGYSTQAALKVHIAHHHSKSKFKCVLCNNLEFHSQLALEGHIYTKHSMEKNDIDELLNETATMNPTLVNMDDSNSYNLINQRSRLIEINNYTNLNNKGDMVTGGGVGGGTSASPSLNATSGDERDLNENGENLKTHYNNNSTTNNNNNTNNCNSNSDGDDENERIIAADDDEDDDVIIEQELRPTVRLGTTMPLNRVSQQQQQQQQQGVGHVTVQMNGYKKIVPKMGSSLPDNTSPYSGGAKTTTTLIKPAGYPTPCQVRPAPSMNINLPSTGANTYCELCNARFSNVESYAAHMRNCHPSVVPQTTVVAASASTNHPNPSPRSAYDSTPKMPYLTSILSTPSSNVVPGKYMTKPTPGIIIPLTNTTSTAAPTVCQVPNCNCRFTNGHHGNDADLPDADYYVQRETNFTCVQCNLSLLKQADFMQHIKQVHCVEVYRCILCKQMQLFDNLALLKDHFFLVHQSHKYDSYRCKLCPSLHSFHTLDDLSLHVKSTHPHPRTSVRYPQAPPVPMPLPAASFKCFKCTQCDSEFTQQNALNQHVQMVHGPGVNSLSCQYCRNTFTNKSQLERHLRIHLTAVDLKCNICDRTFDNQELLIEHKLTHCKTFESNNVNSTPQPSQSNTTTATSTTTTAVCVYCKQLIENEQQFKEHFKRHNNIGLNAANVNTNGRANSFICIVCRQTLTSNSEYYLHLRHHLRRNAQAQPAASQAQPQPLKPSASCPTLGQEPAPAPAAAQACSKFLLKCQKCPVKFEYGQDYVAHLKKFHPNEHGETPSCATTPLSPALSTASQKTNSSSSSLSSSSRNGHVAGSINVKVTAPTASTATAAAANLKEESRSPLSSASSSSISTTTISSSSSSTGKQSTSVGNFLCEICSSKFDSNTKLQTHLLIKHEFQPPSNASGAFVCPVCDETFVRADLLLFHTTIHGQAAKIYKCTKCPQAYVFKSQLINHSFAHQQQQQQSNGPKPATQPTYNLRNRSNDGSADSSPVKRAPPTNAPQITVVRSSRPLNQPSPRTIGPNNTSNNSMIANSQQNWHQAESQFKPSGGDGGQQTYTCTTCSKTFATQRNLSVHIRIHTGFRPFECDVCKRKFTRRENLRSHMKCHLNVRPFSCSICNRSFRRKSHVTSHIEVHFKSKLHNCIECSRQFDQLDVFLFHLINEHAIYDKELLTLVKQKQILDTNKLNIDVDTTINELSLVASRNRRLQMAAAQQAFNRSAASAAAALNPTDESLTIQSLIDQNDDDDYGNDDDYYNNDEVDYQDDPNSQEGEPIPYDDAEDLPDDEEDDYVDNDEIDNDDHIQPQHDPLTNDIDNYLTSIDENAPLPDDDDEIDYTD